MKFRFCWDCDCPDWLLAEIVTLSKINARILRNVVKEVSKSVEEGERDLDFGRVHQLFEESDLEDESMKASVAAIRWIISTAAGALVAAKVLDSELQQLGLPKEQSTALTEVFGQQKEVLQKALREQTFKASDKIQFSCDVREVQVDGEMHQAYSLNLTGKVLCREEGVSSQSSSSVDTEDVSLILTRDQLGALTQELKEAYDHMEQIKP